MHAAATTPASSSSSRGRQQRRSGDDDDTELEDLRHARGELLYEPDSPPSTRASPSRGGGSSRGRSTRRGASSSSSRPSNRRTESKGSYDLVRLLEVWDRAVARRTMKLLSKDPRAAASSSLAPPPPPSEASSSSSSASASATAASSTPSDAGKARRKSRLPVDPDADIALLKRDKQPAPPPVDDASDSHQEEEVGEEARRRHQAKARGAWDFTVPEVLCHVDGNPRPPLEHLTLEEVVAQVRVCVWWAVPSAPALFAESLLGDGCGRHVCRSSSACLTC